VAVAAGVDVGVVRRLERLEVSWLPLGSLVRVAHACGLAATGLVPGLAREPGGAAPILKGIALKSRRRATDTSATG
jgi:hypothetical protein